MSASFLYFFAVIIVIIFIGARTSLIWGASSNHMALALHVGQCHFVGMTFEASMVTYKGKSRQILPDFGKNLCAIESFFR